MKISTFNYLINHWCGNQTLICITTLFVLAKNTNFFMIFFVYLITNKTIFVVTPLPHSTLALVDGFVRLSIVHGGVVTR